MADTKNNNGTEKEDREESIEGAVASAERNQLIRNLVAVETTKAFTYKIEDLQQRLRNKKDKSD